MFIDNIPVPIDHETFGHAIHAPVNRRPPNDVHPDSRVGIAQRTQKSTGIVGLVFIIDARKTNAGIGSQFKE